MTVEEKTERKITELLSRPWYFTFKFGHKYQANYVRIEGTFIEARKKMYEYFGSGFSFQYDELSFLPLEIKYHLTEIKLHGIK